MGHPYRTSARTEGASGPSARGPGRAWMLNLALGSLLALPVAWCPPDAVELVVALLACGTLGLLYVDLGPEA